MTVNKLRSTANCINIIVLMYHNNNKKFELMLARRTKSYSSSCLQTVNLSPAISLQFILAVCGCALQPKIAKINKNPLFQTFRVFQSHRCWYNWKAHQ